MTHVISTKPPLEHRAYPAGVVHNFYIYGPVSDDLCEYVDMISVLDTAEPYDTINIYINTPGGSLETAISIIHAMLRSKAKIITHADGQVASAGTLIFFAAESYVVYPFAHAMFHDGSEIIGGSTTNNLKAATATNELIRKVCMEMYVPFFTEEEVEDILKSGDLYLNADQLGERVLEGSKILQAEKEEQPEE